MPKVTEGFIVVCPFTRRLLVLSCNFAVRKKNSEKMIFVDTPHVKWGCFFCVPLRRVFSKISPLFFEKNIKMFRKQFFRDPFDKYEDLKWLLLSNWE